MRRDLGRLAAWALGWALGLGSLFGCPGQTALDVSVEFDSAQLGFPDRLLVRLAADGDTRLGPVTIPESPRPIQPGERLRLLVPDDLAGESWVVVLDGFTGTVANASGDAQVTVVSSQAVPVEVQLQGPLFCGDGVLRSAVEVCDDGNQDDDDDCTQECQHPERPRSDGGASDGGDGDGDRDAGSSDDAGPADAGPADAGFGDAGFGDAGLGDAGLGDAGLGDAGAGDAGEDAGPGDAGLGDWHEPAFAHRVQINIDPAAIVEDLNGFVVPVRIPANVAAQVDLAAVTFVRGNGNPLDYEFELNASAPSEVTYWVRMNLTAGLSPDVYLYASTSSASPNPPSSAAWGAGFIAVWHLDESAEADAPQFYDSVELLGAARTSATFRGTATSAAAIAGPFGGAVSLAQPNAFIEVEADGAYDVELEEAKTVELWFRSSHTGQRALLYDAEGCQGWFVHQLDDGSVRATTAIGGCTVSDYRTVATEAPVTENAWHHVAFSFDRVTDRMALYVDGAFVGEEVLDDSLSSTFPDSVLTWGANWEGLQRFDGDLDEIRLSSLRTGGWIRATWEMAQDSTVTLGPVENRPQ